MTHTVKIETVLSLLISYIDVFIGLCYEFYVAFCRIINLDRVLMTPYVQELIGLLADSFEGGEISEIDWQR